MKSKFIFNNRTIKAAISGLKILAALGIYFILDSLDKSSVPAILAGYKICALWLFKKKEETVDKQTRNQKIKKSIFKSLTEAEVYEQDEVKEDKDKKNENITNDELNEKKEFWEYLCEVKETLIKESSDARKAAAIYKISRFYTPRHIDFFIHVHTLFKDCLEDFWNNNADSENSSSYIPAHIELIYHLIKHSSHQQVNGMIFFDKTHKINFDDFQLKFANLCYANFINQNFICANLSNANLLSIDSMNADWANTNLTAINLSEANLDGANLIESNLSHASLIETVLINAIMTRANLTHANLNSAELTHADLAYANLTYANLTYANLTRIRLSHANLNNANLSKTNLIGANLKYANLSHSNLSNANLSCTDFTHAILNKANLTCANLSSANLKHAINLHKATLAGAMYCESDDFVTQFPHDFNPEKHNMVLVDMFGGRIKK